MGASIALGFVGGVVVAAVEGGPIGFQGFKGPLSSFAISAVIGVTAGLSSADDTGRRYLIGVAAAVQLAVFPVWLGVATVIGIPDYKLVVQHLLSFSINLVTVAVASVAALRSPMAAVRLGDEPKYTLSPPWSNQVALCVQTACGSNSC